MAGVFADALGEETMDPARAGKFGRSVGMTGEEILALIDPASSSPGLDALEAARRSLVPRGGSVGDDGAVDRGRCRPADPFGPAVPHPCRRQLSDSDRASVAVRVLAAPSQEFSAGTGYDRSPAAAMGEGGQDSRHPEIV